MRFDAILLMLAAASLVTVAGCGNKPAAPAKDFTVVRLRPADGPLPALLRGETKKAAALGQRPFVEIGAEWCEPCNVLHASLGDPLMADAFGEIYLIQLDADAWGDKLSDAGLSGAVVPIFYELDEAGSATGHKLTGSAWKEDTPANMAPVLKKFFSQ